MPDETKTTNLTVGQLRALLAEHPDEALVILDCEDSYYSGPLTLEGSGIAARSEESRWFPYHPGLYDDSQIVDRHVCVIFSSSE